MACQTTDKSGTHVTPVVMTQMPEHPWERVSTDFYGPIQPTKEYLMVLLDDYSRFPLVESIFSTSGTVVIRKLETLFSIFGIPDEERSDNEPPFNG